MNIRLADEQDIPPILELISFIVKNMNKNGINIWNPSYPAITHISSDIKEQHLYILEESEEKEIVGIAALKNQQPIEYETVSNFKKTKFKLIKRLCIHPKVQKQGYGKKIVEFLEDKSKNLGFDSIRLDTWSDLKNVKVHSFYEKMGYEKKEELEMEGEYFFVYEKVL